MNILATSLGGLDLLASAVLILDADGRIAYANVAAESLLDSSFKVIQNQRLTELFINGERLDRIFRQALRREFDQKREDLGLERVGRPALQVNVSATPLDDSEHPVLIELRENIQQLKLDREERQLGQTQANKELIRNLAHEIKNPLGGIQIGRAHV